MAEGEGGGSRKSAEVVRRVTMLGGSAGEVEGGKQEDADETRMIKQSEVEESSGPVMLHARASLIKRKLQTVVKCHLCYGKKVILADSHRVEKGI